LREHYLRITGHHETQRVGEKPDYSSFGQDFDHYHRLLQPPLRVFPAPPSFYTVMMDQWLLVLGLVFLFSSTTVLAVNKRQRDAVLNRLNLHRRRASEASTPPRSFSPSKTVVSISERPNYATLFPPSRREALLEVAKIVSATNSQALLGKEPAKDFLVKASLPMTRAYNAPNAPVKYTPTGFSTAEIKAMGDFPPYDILSGVPLPEPYENFDITKAVPRPYRPFRWAYHQTMCKRNIAHPI